MTAPSFDVVDPSTGQRVRTVPGHDAAEVARRVAACATAQRAWSDATARTRATVLTAVAAALRARRDALAALMTEEMGKPVVDGRAEVEKCAATCEHYAAHAADMLVDEAVATEATRAYVAYRPLGVVLAVMPWNFPLWQVVRCAAPALAAGNGLLLKHAANVPGCALALEELFAAAGTPPGLLTTLLVGHDVVPALLDDDRVAAATLTGSTRAGKALAAAAGARLKKTVLELGGSDAYVVLEDADVEEAAAICARSRLINGGQSCIAAKRFVVVDPVHAAFVAAFTSATARARVGDPRDEATTVGPKARVDLRDALADQVRRSVAAGAQCVLGGDVPAKAGAWYPPTVLVDVQPGMAAFDEETFGPVAAIVSARDEEHAIALANRSRFGLGGAVFTRDVARGERIARERLDAGACFVNAFVKSDPRLPFGGVKESGYGRELGVLGIREFVNAKTVWVA